VAISPLRGANLLPSAPEEKKLTQVTKLQKWVLCGMQAPLPNRMIMKNPTYISWAPN